MSLLLLHLVRHGAHDGAPGTLAGRDPAIRLSPAGREEARALAESFTGRPLAQVIASPQPRTVETAEILARGRGVTIDAALDEIDFGPWAGRSFAELENDPAWRRWNAERDHAATPAGETMADVADRVDGLVASLCEAHPDGAEVALVTHCDVIRAVVCRARGLPFSAVFGFEIDTASRTTLSVDADGTRVLAVNDRPGVIQGATRFPSFSWRGARGEGRRAGLHSGPSEEHPSGSASSAARSSCTPHTPGPSPRGRGEKVRTIPVGNPLPGARTP